MFSSCAHNALAVINPHDSNIQEDNTYWQVLTKLICRGCLARSKAAAAAGFGYDPLFEVVEYHATFGQLGDAVKSALSHRARAANLLVPQLLALARAAAWD